MRTSLLTGLSTGELIATVLLFVLATFAALGWKLYQQRSSSSGSGGPYRITALYIYPIKSCAGVPLASATFNRLGFKFDRQWMIVNAETGRMLTAREAPHLQQVHPVIDEKAHTITCTFALQPDFGELKMPLTVGADAKKRTVDLWDHALEVALVSEEASAWFNRVAHWTHPGAAAEAPVAAQQRYEFVTVLGVAEHKRPLPSEYDASRPGDHIAAGAFSDGFPFLVTSAASLQDLNDKHCIPAGRTVEMLAFRPNIVVAGQGLKAWEEDYWRTVEVRPAAVAAAAAAVAENASSASTAGLRFAASKPCGRCVLTTVVPSTGKRHPSGEPLLSLREHRRVLAGLDGHKLDDEAVFGQNLVQLQPQGTIRVGDAFHVVETKATKHEYVTPHTPKEHAAKKAE